MGKELIQNYLEKGLTGTPKTKPEERRMYLGTLRERIFFVMTIAEMQEKRNIIYLEKEMDRHPKQQLLINDQVGSTVLNSFMKVAQRKNCAFTIVSDHASNSPCSIGLVYSTEDIAINEPSITLKEKYPNLVENKPKERKKEKKTGFWKNW